MGEVGDEGDIVDEQLWGNDKDKPEQSKAEEKYEKDAPVQVSLTSIQRQITSQLVAVSCDWCMDCCAHAWQQQ